MMLLAVHALYKLLEGTKNMNIVPLHDMVYTQEVMKMLRDIKKQTNKS